MDMTLRALIVLVLLAAIVIPVIVAEARRLRPRVSRRPSPPRAPKAEPAVTKPPLRLVVDKNDMDRELAALLAKNSRKPTETDE